MGSWSKLSHANWHWCSGFIGDQWLSLVADAQTTIQELVDIDSRPSVAGALRAGWDLQLFSVEGDGVVVAHNALVLETEKILGPQIIWPRAIGRPGLRWRDTETFIEAGQITQQCLIGLFNGTGLGLPQLFDQAVL